MSFGARHWKGDTLEPEWGPEGPDGAMSLAPGVPPGAWHVEDIERARQRHLVVRRCPLWSQAPPGHLQERPPGALASGAMRRLLVTIVALLAGALPAQAAAPPAVGLAAYVVADGHDGRVLAQRNADEPRAIASITKMMTAYLALQAGALDKTYTVPVAATTDRRVDRGAARRAPGVGPRPARGPDGAERQRRRRDAGDRHRRLGGARSCGRMNRTAKPARHDATPSTRRRTASTPAGQHSTAADQLILAQPADEATGGLRPIVRLRSAVIDGLRLAASQHACSACTRAPTASRPATPDEAGWCLAATAKRGGRRIYVVGLGAADQATPRPRHRAAAGLGLLAAAGRRRRARRRGRRAAVRCRTAAPSTPEVAKTLRLTIRPGERVRLRYRLASVNRRSTQGQRSGQVEVLVGSTRGGEAPLVAARAVAAPGIVRPARLVRRPRVRPVRFLSNPRRFDPAGAHPSATLTRGDRHRHPERGDRQDPQRRELPARPAASVPARRVPGRRQGHQRRAGAEAARRAGRRVRAGRRPQRHADRRGPDARGDPERLRADRRRVAHDDRRDRSDDRPADRDLRVRPRGRAGRAGRAERRSSATCRPAPARSCWPARCRAASIPTGTRTPSATCGAATWS